MLTTTARFLLIAALLAGCQKPPVTPPAPASGGAAVAPAAGQPAMKRLNVGLFVYDGVQVIDYSGPFEIFGQAGFNVFTVAERKGGVTTAMGQAITPRHDFSDAPPLDVLVIPGGDIPTVQALTKDPEVLAWIRSVQPGAKHVMSVCNGAFILAGTGLLDGKEATTYYGLLEELQAMAKQTRVTGDKRFVDNGQIVTTAGLTSGMDGALHIVSEEVGLGAAQQIALNIEYDWQPDRGYARASLADMHIMRALKPADMPKLLGEHALQTVRTVGDERTWSLVLQVERMDVAAASAWLDPVLAKAGWQRTVSEGPAEGHWTFKDQQGQPWKGHTTVTTVGGAVRMEIRVDAGA